MTAQVLAAVAEFQSLIGSLLGVFGAFAAAHWGISRQRGMEVTSAMGSLGLLMDQYSSTARSFAEEIEALSPPTTDRYDAFAMGMSVVASPPRIGSQLERLMEILVGQDGYLDTLLGSLAIQAKGVEELAETARRGFESPDGAPWTKHQIHEMVKAAGMMAGEADRLASAASDRVKKLRGRRLRSLRGPLAPGPSLTQLLGPSPLDRGR